MLRKTSSALALASYLSFATMTVTPRVANAQPETGNGPGLVCLGCVASGIIGFYSGAAEAAAIALIVGGPGAVAVGAGVATCVIACSTYLAQ